MTILAFNRWIQQCWLSRWNCHRVFPSHSYHLHRCPVHECGSSRHPENVHVCVHPQTPLCRRHGLDPDISSESILQILLSPSAREREQQEKVNRGKPLEGVCLHPGGFQGVPRVALWSDEDFRVPGFCGLTCSGNDLWQWMKTLHHGCGSFILPAWFFLSVSFYF